MGNVGAFAEQTFALRGDPAAINASGQVWARFAGENDSTAADLRALDAQDFQGDEADTYRGRLNTDLPPYLDTTSQAWAIVGGALRSYASTLIELQTQLGGLRTTAWTQWQSASAADAAACQAEADDQAHTTDRQHQTEALKPGQKLPADTYHPAGIAARSTAANTTADYTATLTAADQLRSQHTQAVNACADAIDRATAMRFADPPSWLGHLWEKACDWVADHIDILQTLSVVLKQISSIAGMLAMIPILAPLAGPVAAGTGMLAFGIDAGIKITTGQGNWTDIALTGMSFIPGAKAALATDLLSTTNDAAHDNLDWTQLATTAAFSAAGRKAGHGDNVPASRTTPDPDAEPTPAREPSQKADDNVPASRTTLDPDAEPTPAREPSQKAEPPVAPEATPEKPEDADKGPEKSVKDVDVTALTARGIAKPLPARVAPADDPKLEDLLRRRQGLPTASRHLLDFDPDLPGIPQTWVARVARNGNGWIWQHPDFVGTEDNMIRVMGPVQGRHPYPNGYVRVRTPDGDDLGVNGKVSQPLNLSHLPRKPDGTYDVPEGWNGVLS